MEQGASPQITSFCAEGQVWPPDLTKAQVSPDHVLGLGTCRLQVLKGKHLEPKSVTHWPPDLGPQSSPRRQTGGRVRVKGSSHHSIVNGLHPVCLSDDP